MEIDNDESNRGTTETMENGFHLYPVSAYDSGEGLPYAPVDWPQPGDKWRWKVGKRIAASGYFLDRYLYLPKRLQTKPKGRTFASKLSVEQYVRTFPGADVKAFFTSFSWKVPARNPCEIKGTENGLQFLSFPTGETAEQSGSESQPGTRCCKAGNKLCSSLVESEEPPSRAMLCDICCSEPGFCRDCCCILCCKTINTDYGGYSFIKCEASVDEGVICGHIAHVECGLRSYMAGTVGGSIGLDAEYYCRRCDARTDLLSHVTKLLQTCESIDSRDVIEKILNVGALVLRGSQRISAKRLWRQIEIAKGKLKSRTCLEDVWKVENISSVTPGAVFVTGAVSSRGNDASECANKDPLDVRPGSTQKVSKIFDPKMECLKLENEIDQILQTLRKSQESEYNIAQERLYAQKKYLQNLFQQLNEEKCELARHTAYLDDPDALLQLVKNRVDQIKKELLKLKDMEEVAKGFGKTSKEILKEHFGFEM